MLRHKGILFALVVAVVFGSVAAYLALRTPEPAPPVISFLPNLSVRPPLALAPESSGELWRKSVKSADGKFIVEEHVGYRDGRTGVYYFNSGKLTRFVSFAADDNSRMEYEALFDGRTSSNLILRARTYRADGTLEREARQLADGSEHTDFFAADGISPVQSITTMPDGSQRVVTAGSGATPASTMETPAVESEKTFGERTAADGTTVPALRLKLKGVRITSWEATDAQGVIRHRGVFRDDGVVEVMVLTDRGTPMYTQHWTPVGQDWNRKFYRLTRIDAYLDSGVLQASLDLYPDGATPREITNYSSWGGQKNSVDQFDDRGWLLRRQYYYNNDVPTYTQDFPKGQQRVTLQPGILAPPGLDGKAMYNFGGQPFASPAPAQGSDLSPLFVKP